MNPTFVLYSECLGFCIILLAVLFALNMRQWKSRPVNTLSVMYMLIILEAISDLIWYFINGNAQYVEVNKVMQVIYLIVFPYVGLLWLLHTTNVHRNKTKGAKAMMIIYFGLCFVSNALVIASYWTGWVFYFDEAAVYNRGVMFYPITALQYGFVILGSLYALIKSFKTKTVSDRKRNIMEAFFVVPTFIMGIIQIFLEPGIPTTYLGIVISLLLLYVSSLERQITIDSLTKLNNRYMIDNVLTESIRRQQRGTENLLWLVIFDLNDFKQINDTYGHLAGDRAIEETAKALKLVAHDYKTTVGRLGGDEFAIIAECKEPDVINQITTSLPKALKEEAKDEPYELSICYGIAFYEEGMSIKEFIDRADKRLYENKAKLPQSRKGRMKK